MEKEFEVFEQTDGQYGVHSGAGYTSAFMAGVLRISKKMYNAMALKFGGNRDEALQAEWIHFPDKQTAENFVNQFVIPRYEIAKKI